MSDTTTMTAEEMLDNFVNGFMYNGTKFDKKDIDKALLRFTKKFCGVDFDSFLELSMMEAQIGAFKAYMKQIKRLENQLEYAERTLKNIRILMTCDPSDMKELDENFCANQLALETVNGYFEKYGVGK